MTAVKAKKAIETKDWTAGLRTKPRTRTAIATKMKNSATVKRESTKSRAKARAGPLSRAGR